MKAIATKLKGFWRGASAIGRAISAILIAAAAAAAIWVAFGGGANPPRHGELTVLRASVTDGPISFEAPHGVETAVVRAPPSLRLLVKNNGTDSAVIEGVRVRVLRYANLNLCYTQGEGDIPKYKPFEIHLPTFPPTSTETIARWQYQKQVKSGQPAVLTFRFEGITPGEYHAYELELQLLTDSGTVTTHPFVLVTPAGLLRSAPGTGTYLPNVSGTPDAVGIELGSQPWNDVRYTVWCYERNLALLDGLRRLTSLSPAWLRQETAQSTDRVWNQFVRRLRPSGDAASMDTSQVYGADDALFAAVVAGDRDLITTVVRRGTAALKASSDADPDGGITPFEAHLNKLEEKRFASGAALSSANLAPSGILGP